MRVFGACHLDKALWVACVVGEVSNVRWQIRVDLMFLWWVENVSEDLPLARDAVHLMMEDPTRQRWQSLRAKHKHDKMPWVPERHHCPSEWLVSYAYG